ncbi:hypothetical protein IGB42_01391 [Andreprevotia sp. IGB-42]|uniref:DUF4398 domain-containing protein n=1 Tax=Andreprevotia sp. IGB-42 TaxID=2497473 RepID=UPI00135C5407|nr:DUF4398 domain-containing protein [Andreprevotia sp. IGB-42]KAF0814490.1 hypothetical protein IGB42_01391 [Andreprevotia sp. IGB-42]
MKNKSTLALTAIFGGMALLAAGCSSMKTPATSKVAVSAAAVDNATSAGGAEFAPLEMGMARDKIDRANKAMAAKDYKLANTLANEAEADAKLAQGKADSAKAKLAATALQDDLNVLREELKRSSEATQ